MSAGGWIGVDLDGTLAEHYWPEKGPYDPLHIGDPVPAMVARVKTWLAEGREVRIFTARVKPLSALDSIDDANVRLAIEHWCERHIGRALPVTCVKDYQMVELWDDRAVQVAPNKGTPALRLTTAQFDALDWARAQARSVGWIAGQPEAVAALGRRAREIDALLAGAEIEIA